MHIYVGGILATNVKKRFEIDSVKVQLECLGNHKFNNTWDTASL